MASSSSSPMPANGDGDYSVITIASLEETVNGTEWLLDPSAANESCYIFRVPQCLVDINKNSYGPHVVSIGPYHHGEQQLEMMQQHKRRFLHDLLAQTPPNGPGLDDYRLAVALKVEEIRGCYSHSTLKFCNNQLVDMMVLDGLFIIELLVKIGEKSKTPIGVDPIFHFKPVFSDIVRDLLRLENQIPMSVLQILFDASRDSRHVTDYSLHQLALKFFKLGIRVPYGDHDQGKHLLDFLRLSFIPPRMRELGSAKSGVQPPPPPPPPPPVQSARQLHLAGIKFKTRQEKTRQEKTMLSFLDILRLSFIPRRMTELESAKSGVQPPPPVQSARQLHPAGIKFKKRQEKTMLSFLDISFANAVLEIPQLELDDLHTELFLNFIAFEQCYCYPPRHITAYFAFMSCLVHSPLDAAFLCCEHDIIDSQIGTDEDVVNFFRNIGKNVTVDIRHSYLLDLYKNVDDYKKSIWHVQWAGFRFTYFDTPWSFLSALAAVILLLFTATQTFFAVYAYVLPPP